MDNPLWFTTAVQTLAAMLHQWPVLQFLIEILLKSFVLLSVFFLIAVIVRNRISSASRHLLWLNAVLCLAVLPWLPSILSLLGNSHGTGQVAASTALFELTVLPGQPSATPTSQWAIGLLLIYLVPVAVMLGRLFAAVTGARRLATQADPISDPATLQLLSTMKLRLTISRRVHLRRSNAIESPVSCGLFAPVIILPTQADHWNESIMTDVLLHELCHIKRLDWLTMLMTHLVACAYWINPLVWHLVRHMGNESEHSCDTAVLNAGRGDTDYAESLLGVATRCRHDRRRSHKNQQMLMQTMLDQNTLITRISRVLEENKMPASEMKQEIKRSAMLLVMVSVSTLAMLGATQLLSAQDLAAQELAAQDMASQQPVSPPSPPPATRPAPPPGTDRADGEMFPVHTEEPFYPRVAADGGIEGWVQVSFTVSADGSVPTDSISVIDAEPADVFNNSAVNAAAKFRFSPRIVEGEGVAVENVQYVFRYKLRQEPDPATAPE